MSDQTLHSDLRSPSIPPLRAHARAAKWRHTTTTPTPGLHWTASAPISTPIPRPSKQPRITRGPLPSSKGAAMSHALRECADQSCAWDDRAHVRPGEPVGDEAIFYSFDNDASPASSLGLDGLVDKAERHFVERETERIVRSEYEMLDGEGERVRRRGKGRGVVEGEGGEEVEGEVGGAWEAI